MLREPPGFIRSPLVEDPRVRFFVITSNLGENVVKSVEHNVWATQRKNEDALTDAFLHSKAVILIFSVNKSGAFQGYARMRSLPGLSKCRTNPFGGYGRMFDVEWLRLQDVVMPEVSYLRNSLDGGREVGYARDGQEMPAAVGAELCRHFDVRVYLEDPKTYEPCLDDPAPVLPPPAQARPDPVPRPGPPPTTPPPQPAHGLPYQWAAPPPAYGYPAPAPAGPPPGYPPPSSPFAPAQPAGLPPPWAVPPGAWLGHSGRHAGRRRRRHRRRSSSYSESAEGRSSKRPRGSERKDESLPDFTKMTHEQYVEWWKKTHPTASVPTPATSTAVPAAEVAVAPAAPKSPAAAAGPAPAAIVPAAPQDPPPSEPLQAADMAPAPATCFERSEPPAAPAPEAPKPHKEKKKKKKEAGEAAPAPAAVNGTALQQPQPVKEKKKKKAAETAPAPVPAAAPPPAAVNGAALQQPKPVKEKKQKKEKKEKKKKDQDKALVLNGDADAEISGKDVVAGVDVEPEVANAGCSAVAAEPQFVPKSILRTSKGGAAQPTSGLAPVTAPKSILRNSQVEPGISMDVAPTTAGAAATPSKSILRQDPALQKPKEADRQTGLEADPRLTGLAASPPTEKWKDDDDDSQSTMSFESDIEIESNAGGVALVIDDGYGSASD